MKFFLLFILFTTTQATTYLTADDFDDMTQGKKAFVAFKAPWCGHCKNLKPDWDKLSEEVEAMIAEVDCTKEKDLCQKHGVKGYPTLKYSDGVGWKKYEQGRDYQSLEAFVTDTLQENCFDNVDLCTEEELKKIEKTKNLTNSELEFHKNHVEEQLQTLEELFKTQVEKLQQQYKKLSEEKTTLTEQLNVEMRYLNYVKEEL